MITTKIRIVVVSGAEEAVVTRKEQVGGFLDPAVLFVYLGGSYMSSYFIVVL